MSSLGTLYTVSVQHKGNTIKAVAAYAGKSFDNPVGYKHFETNKEAWFLEKFPQGKIPALETKDGFRLWEGIAIARYIASLAPNSGLLGHSPEDAAKVDQWCNLIESEVDVPTDNVRAMTISSRIPYNKVIHNIFVDKQKRALKSVNDHLATCTFLVGERITLADFWVAGFVQRACQNTIDAQTRAGLPHLIRHLETIVNQPQLKEFYGPLNYCEKGVEFVPPPKEKKEAKPAAAPAPKAEKPKAKPKEDDDDEDDAVPAEPKAKNPLDDLPKSSFNLEDWKRQYSNKETRGPGGSIEWFYENFDKEGFSIWRVDFKYNSELTIIFMSSNQVGGFFNRLEGSRKYLFGSMGVLGENNNSVISGVLIMRGQELDKVVQVAPDWESYDYKKLDLANEADKAFFEASLAWDLEIDGKKWKDGKNFK